MTTAIRLVAVVLVATLGACASGDDRATPAPSVVSTLPPTMATAPTTTTGTSGVVEIPLRLDRRVADAATEGFAAAVTATLTDGRGWAQAGFVFTFAEDAPYRVVLAEGDEVDALCLPYDVGGRFSCQNGPVVALNADRWRSATPDWPGDVATYREMLVNHEVGHLIGLHHPEVRCPVAGDPAPVMAQQSSGLDGCRPNPWPLPWEIQCAAQRLEPIAPGYEDDPAPLCGPEDV